MICYAGWRHQTGLGENSDSRSTTITVPPWHIMVVTYKVVVPFDPPTLNS